MADVPEDEQQDDGGRVDRRSVLKYGGSSAVAAGLAGCQSPQNPYPGSGLRGSGDDGTGGGLTGENQGDGEQLLSGSTVRFGVLAPTNLPLGQSMWEAAQLAAEQYNNSGGMLGAKVEVYRGASDADPNQTVSEYNRLINQERCDITLGVFLGSALIRMMNQAMAPAEKIHITTASADPRAGQLVSNNVDLTGNGAENEYERFKYHFRAGPINLLDLADAMLEFLENEKENRGWETIGVLTENPAEFSPYHDRLVDGLGEIVDVPIAQRVSGGTKWRSVYNEVESENCDLALVGLALAGTKAVTQWANQRRNFSFGGIHVPAQSFGYWDSTGGKCEYVFTMNAMTPQTANTELTQKFVQAYQEKFDRAPVYSGAITYDAISLTEQALRMTLKGEGTEGEVPDAETMVGYLEEGTFTDSTILKEFQFTPADSEYAHEPQWTSIEETGVPVFQQWQNDPETRPDYGTMHSFYPEQNKTADYAVPEWIGGGG